MLLKKREILLLTIYLFVLLATGIYFFVFKFAFNQYRTVKEQIATAQNARVKLNAVLANKDLVEREYNKFEKKLSPKKILESVSTQILNDMRSKAISASLNVINIKPFSLKDEGIYGTFDFKLETEGEIKNLGNFLYNLDDSPYIFSIKFLQLNAQTQGPNLKIQLLLSAIFPKE